MKRIKIISLSVFALLSCSVSVAQSFNSGGVLSQMAMFNPPTMAMFSTNDYALGTARSAAMGGAFTSLGADLSSMSINPAGLGMYLGSEVGVTARLGINSMSGGANVNMIDGNNVSFSIGNLGVAMNMYQGSGALTNFTFGFGYNVLADFNSNNAFALDNSRRSLADVFVMQMEGVNSDLLYSSEEPFDNYNLPITDWGAILGFQTSLIDPVSDGSDQYVVSRIAADTDISHYVNMVQRGAISEYNISGGFNFQNVLYMGFSLGLQDMYYRLDSQYEEGYLVNPIRSDVSGDELDYMIYGQSMRIDGSGVNFKFGVTARPIDGLKIGVAVHTPTYVSMSQRYIADMYTQTKADGNGHVLTGDKQSPQLNSIMSYTSPARLLTGVSYTFGGLAILSADYERTWYNGMRFKSDYPMENELFKSEIKNDYKAQNSFRLGAEVRPIPFLSLRAGFNYVGSSLNDDNVILNRSIATNVNGYSAGVGYRGGAFSLDLAYAFSRTKYTEYDLFYHEDLDGIFTPSSICIGMVNQSLDRHGISLSMGLRF